MSDDKNLQVFGVSIQGDQITGSTTIEELLISCEQALPIRDVHLLVMENGNVASKKIGRIGIQFYKEEELFKKEPSPTQIEPQRQAVPAVDPAPALKIKPLTTKKKKRGRPRKIKDE